MKKIVLFGATGSTGVYFADWCAKHLDSKQFELIAVGRKKTPLFKNLGICYETVDLRCAEDFDKLPSNDVYAVVNMTGLLPAYMKTFDPFAYAETNLIGSLRVLEYARRVGADRALYTQTWAEMAAFWGKETVLRPTMHHALCYTGDHAFYTITKTAVVDTMRFYQEEYGVKSFVFRLPNIYLYNPVKTYFVDGVERPIAYRYMIDRVRAGQDLEMWGDPDAFKDIIYVKDLCRMMFGALFADVNGGVYNAGTGVATTLREQLEGIVEVFSPSGAKVQIIPHPEKSSFTSFVMDIDNAKKDLGYTPEFDYHLYLMDYKKEMEEKRFDSLWI